MPIKRKTQSIVGKFIVKDVTDFINQNSIAMEKDINISTREGAEALANAICYAISKALSTPQIQIAFNLGVSPPSGIPGTLIYNGLKPNVKET